MNLFLGSEELLGSSKSKAERKYFAALTGVRAIAAFMVFFVHFNPINSTAPDGSITSYLYNIVCHFHIGVSIFFVLSGFLITFRYQSGIQLSWNWIRRYVRNRIARIYPLYFIITVITALVSQAHIQYDPSHLWHFYNAKDKVLVVLMNLTLLRGFFDRYLRTIVGQGWSLTVEECFYLSAPLLILGLRHRPGRLVAYPLILVGIGTLLVILCAPFHDRLFGLFGSFRFVLNWTFFGRATEFVCGMALALWLARRPAGPNPTSRRRGWATALGLVWIAGCLCALVYFERSQPADLMGSDLFSPGAILTRNFVLPVGIAGLFWGLTQEHSWLRSLLESKPFDLLGKSSYAFYLVHGGILNFLLNDFVTTNVAVKFVITNVVAIFLYKFIEHPLHRVLAFRPATKAK